MKFSLIFIALALLLLSYVSATVIPKREPDLTLKEMVRRAEADGVPMEFKRGVTESVKGASRGGTVGRGRGRGDPIAARTETIN